MVAHVDRSGLRDWLVQRVTAVLIGAYALLIYIYIICHPGITYDQWHALFSHLAMKMFTFVVLLSILWHAWIGLWTVFTDYVKNRPIRLVLETVVCLVLIAFLAWTIEILWIAG